MTVWQIKKESNYGTYFIKYKIFFTKTIQTLIQGFDIEEVDAF